MLSSVRGTQTEQVIPISRAALCRRLDRTGIMTDSPSSRMGESESAPVSRAPRKPRHGGKALPPVAGAGPAGRDRIGGRLQRIDSEREWVPSRAPQT